MPAGRRRPLGYPTWAALVVACGVLLRIRRWSGRRSLNSDELWIAVNLQRRSFAELHGRLDFDQIAPPGWLWLHKLGLAAGRGDALLRLPELIAACAAVALTAVLARRLLPAPLALAAVALAAGTPALIYQASQLKPYSVEAAATVLLLILALRALDDPARRRLLAFWLTGAVAVWFATTALFVTGAMGGLLLLFAAASRRWVLLRDHAIAAAPTAASMLLVYLAMPSPVGWLRDWWSTTYPGSLAPRHLGPRSALTWSRDVFHQFARSALAAEHDRVRWLVLGLMAAGAVALAVRRPRTAALVTAPLAAGYLLALLRLYPMATRVALWLVPVAWILLCAGLDGLLRLAAVALLRARWPSGTWWGRAPRAAGGVAAAVAALLIATHLQRFGHAQHATNAERFARAQPAVEMVAERRLPGDVVLVHGGKSEVAMIGWYGRGAGLRPDSWYSPGQGDACRAGGQPAGMTAASRVWLVRVSWVPKPRTLDAEKRAMARFARLAGEYWYGGVVVALYEKAPGAAPPPGAPCLLDTPARF